jgi:hypothetical protein
VAVQAKSARKVENPTKSLDQSLTLAPSKRHLQARSRCLLRFCYATLPIPEEEDLCALHRNWRQTTNISYWCSTSSNALMPLARRSSKAVQGRHNMPCVPKATTLRASLNDPVYDYHVGWLAALPVASAALLVTGARTRGATSSALPMLARASTLGTVA